MQKTWLIQRLTKPKVGDVPNPFVFGGGGGRMSHEARKLCLTAFEFDYMGAGEFEFGAVPTALHAIAQSADKFVTDYVAIPYKSIKLERWEEKYYEKPSGRAEAFIYLFCHPDHKEYVRELVGRLISGNPRVELKESTLLKTALLKTRDGADRGVCGWLELDNGFFFFTEREMFENTVKMFGQQPPTFPEPKTEPVDEPKKRVRKSRA